MSATCCDEPGWALDSRGLPIEPAVKCSLHPQKQGLTKKPADPAAPADAPDTRDGNKNKFAWFYDMLADPTVSLAAKVVGTGCCMKMAGRKGHFKATRKAVANLCGISQSTVRRGLADLIEKRFLDADLVDGAASTYHLILPAQRWQHWLDAEKEHQIECARTERDIGRWLWAEKLHKENQFRDAVCEASMARGADPGRARQISDRLLGKFRERDIELGITEGLAWVAASKPDVFVPDDQRADPSTPESRGRSAREPGSVRLRADPGTPESRPRLTPDADTSGDDQTHKSFKDSERPVKVFQDSESELALRDALTRALRSVRPSDGTCELCGPDGLFRDPEGFLVVLAEWSDDDEDCTEHPVQCQHSMAGNLAEIRRREKAESLELCKTEWPEIDAHYPLFDDGDSADFATDTDRSN